mgnify:CR=1 FL=1
MSTRCLIGKENKDKTITYIYCHHDGYPSWVGKTLLHHYTDETKLNNLLALGDMSSLGTEPIAKEFNCDAPKEERDRYCDSYALSGEDVPAVTIKDETEFLKQDRWQEYIYLFREGKWYIATPDGFKELTEEMCKSK